MSGSKIGRRIALALATVGSIAWGLAASPVPVAALPYACQYHPQTHYLEVQLYTNTHLELSRDESGTIHLGADPCNGATVSNTDRIAILASTGNEVLTIRLGNGGFKPGFTNEPGSSDEIEFTLFMDTGADVLTFVGGPGNDNLRFGYSPGIFNDAKVNLNAGETTGVDSDLVMGGVDSVVVSANGGADVLSGAGGAGTGTRFTHKMTMFGGDGADQLTGGSAKDNLYGGPGSDVLKGGPANDLLATVDGVGGNDTADGGNGDNDTCVTDPGDTEISC